METLSDLSLLVNCIYRAPEGEGIRLGIPQVFLRLQGCSIGCKNCDTKETWDFNETARQSLKDIISKITALKLKTLSITGGDPLDPRHEQAVKELVRYFKSKNYFINIEASGLKISKEIFDLVDFISFDFKTPSTGVKTPVIHLLTLAKEYAQKSQVKAVIAHQKDFSAVYECYVNNPDLHQLNWVLTPCFEPKTNLPKALVVEIVKWCEELSLPFRVILQQHKVIYGPDEKQV